MNPQEIPETDPSQMRRSCEGVMDLFFSPGDDGRNEVGRREREKKCKNICATCPVRIPCLWKALVWNERLGVWGGMSEAERRRFRTHLRKEGYTDEMPQGMELRAAMASFYSQERHIPVRAEDV